MNLFLLAIFASNMSCQDPDSQSDKRDDSRDWDADLLANEPVMVGGSFLRCAVIDDGSAQDGMANTGCAIENESGKVELDREYDIRIALRFENGFRSYPNVTSLERQSPWHWSFVALASELLIVEIEIEINDPDFPFEISNSKTRVLDPNNILSDLVRLEGTDSDGVQVSLNLLNTELASVELNLLGLLTETGELEAEIKALEISILEIRNSLEQISLLGDLIQINLLNSSLSENLLAMESLNETLQMRENEIQELTSRKQEIEGKIAKLLEEK